MKSSFLLPNRYKPVGWILFALGIVAGIAFLIKAEEIAFFDLKVPVLFSDGFFSHQVFCSFVNNNILDEIAALLIISGALLVMFSKEKNEDEFIASIRLNALSWATVVNYAILLIAICFVYDFSFFWILVFNMFTILFIFLLRFYWLMYQSSKTSEP